MKPLDIWLQRQRIAKIEPWIVPGSAVLDVGCADGALFDELTVPVRRGVGIDPVDHQASERAQVEIRVGFFPGALGPDEAFDAITMLAVVEHLPVAALHEWASEVPQRLMPGGRLLITTPSPLVDHLLHLLIALRLIDGMEAHQHYGFKPGLVPGIFCSPRLRLVHRRRFQLGLNNLFVFERV